MLRRLLPKANCRGSSIAFSKGANSFQTKKRVAPYTQGDGTAHNSLYEMSVDIKKRTASKRCGSFNSL
jgi:hypothetical protein